MGVCTSRLALSTHNKYPFHIALETGNVDEAQRLLDACETDQEKQELWTSPQKCKDIEVTSAFWILINVLKNADWVCMYVCIDYFL
jgi:hypothetical protein